MPAAETTHDFSVAWGYDNSATKAFRPYCDDAEAKSYRDAIAATLRKQGHKVRLSTVRNQRREYWGWQEPCGITCTVYRLHVEQVAQAA